MNKRIVALIEEAEARPGSSMYCKVTTYELRKALGEDVTEWPPPPACPWCDQRHAANEVCA